MAEIRSISKVTEKWKTVTPLRAEEYRDGVNNPKRDWAKASIDADGNYVKGVTQAAQQGRYKGGVAAAGTSKWQENAAQKGPNRFSEGVMLGAGAYEEGFQPFHDVIAKTELPPRGPKGDPANINRVAVIAKALNEKRVSMQK